MCIRRSVSVGGRSVSPDTCQHAQEEEAVGGGELHLGWRVVFLGCLKQSGTELSLAGGGDVYRVELES